MAQWIRIHLPMPGTRVPSLAQEDPTCHGAPKPEWQTTEPAPWSLGAASTEPVPRARAPRGERPLQGEAHTPQLESSPHSPQPGRGLLTTAREGPAHHSQGGAPAHHSQRGACSPKPERGPCSPQPGRGPRSPQPERGLLTTAREGPPLTIAREGPPLTIAREGAPAHHSQGGACSPQPGRGPCSPQLEKSLRSNEDAVQPKTKFFFL